jgi:creatinine deaminase
MPADTASIDDKRFVRLEYEEAKAGYEEGGVPLGAVMLEQRKIIGRGRNRRVQDGNPVSHGESECMKNAGHRRDYSKVTMYITLSPRLMCTGTIIQFGIGRVVICENKNGSGNSDFLKERGVEVTLLDDPGCIELMKSFITKRPDLCYEDIARKG